MSNTHIVIMAGGVGSRLYPVSTPEKPKQFLDLLGVGKTLIQLTYERFLAVDPDAHFWVVTSAAYHKYIREQLPAIPDEQILLEPVARNTAPCVAYVSWKIAQRYPDARVVVAPSDAYVPDIKAFAGTIN
ncbi:MAG: mannose-1-phosphate guanylyltransferase, partial [Bacteroidales bacterium]|nr:mannose-1-phosphate guanylyltransferase [Bacteroidales bacterium]